MPSTLLFLTIIAVMTSVISATIGMAGGIVLLSLMTLVLPYHLLIPIHGVVQLVSNSSRTITLFRHIDWRLIGPFILGLPIGVLISITMIKQISSPELFYFLIALLILYTLFKPKKLKAIQIPVWGFFFVGLVSGFLSLLVGATGPFLAPFFLREELDKKALISSKSSAQTLTHLLKIPAFLSLGFPYFDHIVLIGSMSAASIAGTLVGVKILDQISEEFFLKLFKTVMFLISCRLLYLVVVSVY